LSDELLSQIVAALKTHSNTLQDLTGVIIFSGPGSFTSLRIGHSVANALADSLAIPIVGTQGNNWLKSGLLQLQEAKPGQIALPHYGAEAHITRPKA
jgi:tRNA threonylcarbamoyladenosine biosynthesis protein TsaB